MTPHDIALLRLTAQRLVGPRLASPRDVVGHLLALQAQDEPGALLSVALRCGATRDAVRAAFDAGDLARTWPMRGTLHTVLAEDLPWLVELLTPRPRAAAAKRRGQLGLAEDDVDRARTLAESALAGGGLPRAGLMDAWESAGLPTSGGRGYHLLAELAQRGVVCLGPYAGGEQRCVLVAEHVARPRRPGRDEALAEVALRYFRGHGPATLPDLVRWTGVTVADARAALAAVRHDLAAVTVDGVEHLLAPETLEAHAEARADVDDGVLLLPGFDELVLGYADRTATLAAEHADRVVPGGNGVFRPTVVVGGRAVATWRTVGSGARRRLELEPFGRALPARVARAAERAWAELP